MRTLLATIPILAALACQGPSDPTPDISRVAIVGLEDVESPQIGRERVFLPQLRQTVDDGQGGGIDVFAFHAQIDTTEPAALRLRLAQPDAGHVALVRLDDDELADWESALDHPAAQAALQAGQGVFWVEDQAAQAGLTKRVAVLVPADQIRPRTLLQAFVSTTAGGAPLGGDAVELAAGFFYMAAIGDSAMWGNGLREQDKFSSLVAAAIEEARGVRVIRDVYAISGAAIVPRVGDAYCALGCTGEVPRYYTSITLQALRLPDPEALDLLLVDGCGNDISLGVVLSLADQTEEIARRAERYCHGAMANLLLVLRSLTPDTPIVVTGYFPFLSEASDLSGLGVWAESQGIDLGEEEDYAPFARNLIANSDAFAGLTRENLLRAVDFAAARTPDTAPIVYADAGYTAGNATFAADAWLWGLTIDEQVAEALDFNLPFVPEDPMLDYRIQACSVGQVAPGLLNCIYGSLGHPNPTGARAYAEAIIARLREIGLLP